MEGSEADKDQVRGMFSESMDSESWCLHRTSQTTDCNFFCRWGSSLANTHCGGSQALSGWGALRRLAVWMFEKLPGHEGPHWRQAMVGDVSASLRLWVQHWCSADWSTARIIFFFLGGGRTFFVYITKAISQELKLELMAAAHRDASHMGGRDAVLGALKAQAVHWNHLKLDASWLVAKCQQCAARKTSGMCKAPCRTLPRPLAAGDVVGVDLKTVTPPSGAKDKWTMLVLRDFTSGRVWAWDLDDGQCLGNRPTELLQNRIFPPPKSMCTICSKAMPEFVTHPMLFLNMFTLKIWTIAGTFTFVFVVRRQLRKGLTEVQTLLVRWYTETDVPLCVWSDNGSQFRSVVAESLRRAFNIEPRYIPAAHPQSNGLVEVTLGFRAGVGTVFLFPISVYVYIYIYYIYTYW